MVSLGALLALLVVAWWHPRGRVELAVGLAAAGTVMLAGALPPDAALDQLALLGPVVAFLVVVLVLAEACRSDGLFTALGARLARAGGRGATQLLGVTFLAASTVTAVLGLDATVVLLTPVVAAAATRRGLRPRPHVFACAHLANSASLLFPVSNLTNLLAIAFTGLGFVTFTLAMAPVWLVAIAVEYGCLRLYFGSDLRALPAGGVDVVPDLPRVPLVVLALVLVGFVASSPFGVEPAWVAGTGAGVLTVRLLLRRRLRPAQVVRAAHLPFAFFVLCLGVVVAGVRDAGLGARMDDVLSDGGSLSSLWAIALVALVAANLLNNLPATLLLVPLVAASGSVPVLAVLVGVNVGSNLTYLGSLSNLLWRRVLTRQGEVPSGQDFHRLGLLTAGPTVVTCVVVLWAWTSATGLAA